MRFGARCGRVTQEVVTVGDSVRRVAFLKAVGTLLVLVFAMDASAQDWAPYAPTGGSATEFEPGSVSSDGGILAGLGQMIYNVVACRWRVIAALMRRRCGPG